MKKAQFSACLLLALAFCFRIGAADTKSDRQREWAGGEEWRTNETFVSKVHHCFRRTLHSFFVKDNHRARVVSIFRDSFRRLLHSAGGGRSRCKQFDWMQHRMWQDVKYAADLQEHEVQTLSHLARQALKRDCTECDHTSHTPAAGR